MNTKEAIKCLEKSYVCNESEIIALLKCGEKYKELIIDQRLKIKELEEEIKIQDNLIKEYMAMLNKYEQPGLLMDAVGRKLLLDAVDKEE